MDKYWYVTSSRSAQESRHLFFSLTITLALRYKIVIYKGESFLIAGTASTLFLEISNLALEVKEAGLDDKSVSYIPTPMKP